MTRLFSAMGAGALLFCSLAFQPASFANNVNNTEVEGVNMRTLGVCVESYSQFKCLKTYVETALAFSEEEADALGNI